MNLYGFSNAITPVIGQTVWLVPEGDVCHRLGNKYMILEGNVTRIGQSYFYVDSTGGELRFELATGRYHPARQDKSNYCLFVSEEDAKFCVEARCEHDSLALAWMAAIEQGRSAEWIRQLYSIGKANGMFL